MSGGWKCELGTVPAYNSCNDGFSYNSRSDCQSYIAKWNGNYTCEQIGEVQEWNGIGDYTEDYNTIPNSVFLKHDVVDGIITNSYACFISDTLHCLQGGSPIYHSANKAILENQTNQDWFVSQGGSCIFNVYANGTSNNASCSKLGFQAMAYSNGNTQTLGGYYRCGVYSDGSSCVDTRTAPA